MRALVLAAMVLFGGPRIDFHGLRALVVRNPVAEVVVVAEIGRVMRFALRGEAATAAGAGADGPFWVNPTLGQRFAPDAEGWSNHGGDKAWPAPQSDWPAVAGRGWPPPAGFDSTPFTATVSVEGRRIDLVSGVDAAYGIRVRRAVTLDAREPLMTIETTYEKVDGPPVRVAVWTITQLTAPERLFVELPARSAFPRGHVTLKPAAPADLRVDGRLLSLAHHPSESTMIGSDGATLLWVGQGVDLLVAHAGPRGRGDWPNGGVRSQVYTNPAPAAKYVELELLDRLHDLAPGQSASMRARYRLVPRVERDAEREARRVLSLPPSPR